MRLSRSSIFAALALCACASDPFTIADRDGETNHVLEHASGRVLYKVTLPRGYEDDSSRKWPMLVFLHGAGERGRDLEKVAIHGPVRIARRRDLPYVIVAPLCPSGRAWRNAELVKLIEHCKQRYRIDQDRVSLTGLSMGGYGTWSLGLTHPELFAALVPICGGGETLTARMLDRKGRENLGRLAIWAFHGAKDRVVVLEESQRMVRLAQKLGVRVQLTVYDDVGHAAWKPAYADPDLWSWLSEQSR